MARAVPTLTSVERIDIERNLREQQRALRTEIKAHLRGSGDSGVIGLASVPDEMDDWGAGDELAARDIAEARQLLAALTDVEGALGRLAAGSYGECLDCGRQIAPARLKAYPAAMRCVACQEAVEKRSAGPPLTAV